MNRRDFFKHSLVTIAALPMLNLLPREAEGGNGGNIIRDGDHVTVKAGGSISINNSNLQRCSFEFERDAHGQVSYNHITLPDISPKPGIWIK